MADLLPSSPDSDVGEDGDPRVIGVDSDDADDLLAALQSDTARELLGALYDDPATPSALADEVDTSIQNARYHLEKLIDADLVEVADTVYSEKGREMKVYAPAAKPLVVFAGSDDETPGLEAALSRLLGGLGVLGLSSLLVQRLFGSTSLTPDVSFSAGDSAAAPTTEENASVSGAELTTDQEIEEATTATEESGGGGLNAASDTAADAAEPTTAESAETTAEATRTATEATQAATQTEATRLLTETTRTADAVRATTEEAVTTTVSEEAATTAVEAAGAATGGLPPGLVFFVGGIAVLAALGVAWYLRAR